MIYGVVSRWDSGWACFMAYRCLEGFLGGRWWAIAHRLSTTRSAKRRG